MYKYSDNNSGNDISLHDCRASRILFDSKKITFVFEEGFYLEAENANNYNNKLSYTGRSEIVFDTIHKKTETDMIIYVFSDTAENNKMIREEISPAELAEMMNNGAELEFLYSYKGDSSYLYNCWLRFGTEHYHKECEIIISADNVTYYWNEIFAEEI